MSTSLTTKNIYKEYEKQLASLPGPTSYATIIAGYRKNTTIAPSILKTPFYAGVVEIGLFADELIKLADSAMSIAEITADLADFLSTELFLLPYDEASALAAGLDGVEALWVMPDGDVRTSEGMGAMMRSLGATGAK